MSRRNLNYADLRSVSGEWMDKSQNVSAGSRLLTVPFRQRRGSQRNGPRRVNITDSETKRFHWLKAFRRVPRSFKRKLADGQDFFIAPKIEFREIDAEYADKAVRAVHDAFIS